MSSFIIIDGNALLHRGYHALPNLTTSRGEPTGALFGFCSTLLTVLRELDPSHVAVTFDRPEPTFRHERYAEYKAHRDKMDDVLAQQIPSVKRLVSAFSMPIFEQVGFEADDVVGTLVRLAHEEQPDMPVYIVTGDLDALQLVDEHTRVYTLRKGLSDTVIYDEQAVYDRFGFAPSALIDYKALRGDPSDNIPGVAGIGEKTATLLIQRYGTLEHLYDEYEVDETLNARVRKLLREGRDAAFFSRELATIVRDVSIEFSLEWCVFTANYDRDMVVAFLQEKECTSLIRRLPKFSADQSTSSFSSSQYQSESSAATKHVKSEAISGSPSSVMQSGTIVSVDTEGAFVDFFAQLAQCTAFAFGLMLSSSNPQTAELIGITFSWEVGKGYFVPVVGDDAVQAYGKNLSWAQEVFCDEQIAKYGHDLKQAAIVLHRYGITLHPFSFDTKIASYVLDPTENSTLPALCERELGKSFSSDEQRDALAIWELVNILAQRLQGYSLPQ